MRLFVYIEQIFRIHVRIPLSCRETRVAQKLLDRPKVPATLQQMSREGVTKGVGAGLCPYRSPLETPCDDPPDRSVRKRLPLDPGKDRIPARDLLTSL